MPTPAMIQTRTKSGPATLNMSSAGNNQQYSCHVDVNIHLEEEERDVFIAFAVLNGLF